MPSRTLVFALSFGALASAACAEVDPSATIGGADAGVDVAAPPPVNADDGGAVAQVAPVGPPHTGLHVAGNQILDSTGAQVVVHGVNRSGTEYKCVQSGSIFDGPSDERSIQAIVGWKANAVRVPLNESCWLAINGAPAATSGDAYKAAIADYVALLHKYNIVPILELHWVGPGTSLAVAQQPMPDIDHAPAFWQSVATAFAADDGVLFELYNEPFPDSNMESAAAWSCWQSGCSNVPQSSAPDGGPSTYTAAGMQDLVDAVRGAETAVHHVLLLGGIQFSNDLTHWLDSAPADPMLDIAAAWHIYNNNPCVTTECWNGAPAAVAATVPLVATEIGEGDCGGTFIDSIMQWLDGETSSYLAWSWDAFGPCTPSTYNPTTRRTTGNPYSLIVDYASGTPNAAGTYAQTFHDHLATLSP